MPTYQDGEPQLRWAAHRSNNGLYVSRNASHEYQTGSGFAELSSVESIIVGHRTRVSSYASQAARASMANTAYEQRDLRTATWSLKANTRKAAVEARISAEKGIGRAFDHNTDKHILESRSLTLLNPASATSSFICFLDRFVHQHTWTISLPWFTFGHP